MSNDNSAFLVNFSIPVWSVSVAMGDYNTIIDVTPEQDDDMLTVRAYSGSNASGKLLDRDDRQLLDNPSEKSSFSFKTLSVETDDTCINSILMIGGSGA